MENASKALLIAAAVLIVILLIAFGMRIFNSTGDTSGQAEQTASSTSMQTFNAQFTAYKGKITGTSFRNLVSVVNTSNKGNPQHIVTMDASKWAITDSEGTKIANILTSDKNQYKLSSQASELLDNVNSITISFGYDDEGYINAINMK